MTVGWRWLIGFLAGAALGATWGYLGNSYEPGDSAIGTGLLGALVGIVAGGASDAIGRARQRHGRDRSWESRD
jgi:uncharacterized membrane protein